MGLQKYLGRLKELKRLHRRHSAFWVGLYGQLWVGALEFWADLAHEFMRLKPGKLPIFRKVYVLWLLYNLLCSLFVTPSGHQFFRII
jgi:hypothetical protein